MHNPEPILPMLQEVVFHFEDGRISFAQLHQLPDGSFHASQTMALNAGSSGEEQFYAQVPCPAQSTAIQAFEQMVERARFIAEKGETSLSAVNNPNNARYIPIDLQKQFAPGIEIRLNGEKA